MEIDEPAHPADSPAVSFVRWDEESLLRVVVSLVAMAIGAYGLATTEPTYYLHLPSVALLVFSIWGLLLAVVPDLRGKPGNPHRVLILAASVAVVLLVIFIAGRAAVST